jgi:putative colanic acid biosynthesis UDP-glucose lipid carrier transferase
MLNAVNFLSLDDTEAPAVDPPLAALGRSRAQASDPSLKAVGCSIAKRGFDIVVALAALIFIAPMLIVAAAAIRMESGGPVFFKQRRTGYKGERFVILKFRTMRVLEDGAELRHATRNDARVTRVGAFLRKSSIDELPQLINVLKGDMSLVGPRPHALAHDQYYSSKLSDYNLRFQARPGLTGLAQISGLRGEVDGVEFMARRVKADIDYIDRWSPALDMQIMLKTVPLLFHDPRAY